MLLRARPGMILLCALFSAVSAVNEAVIRCSGLHPQQSMDLDQVLGMWYAVEVVYHWDSSRTNQPAGRTVVDSCPVIHISRSHLNEHRLRMLWTENAGVIEYNFNVHDLRSPGFWMTLGAQNGTLMNSKRYRQFAGTVEVTKAVGTHMVLTFCTPGAELYSVILSREKSLPETELLGVNRMLEHRGLPRLAIKEACRSSGYTALPTFFLFLILLAHFC